MYYFIYFLCKENIVAHLIKGTPLDRLDLPGSYEYIHSKNSRSIRLPTERRILLLNYTGNYVCYEENCTY